MFEQNKWSYQISEMASEMDEHFVWGGGEQQLFIVFSSAYVA